MHIYKYASRWSQITTYQLDARWDFRYRLHGVVKTKSIGATRLSVNYFPTQVLSYTVKFQSDTLQYRISQRQRQINQSSCFPFLTELMNLLMKFACLQAETICK